MNKQIIKVANRFIKKFAEESNPQDIGASKEEYDSYFLTLEKTERTLNLLMQEVHGAIMSLKEAQERQASPIKLDALLASDTEFVRNMERKRLNMEKCSYSVPDVPFINDVKDKLLSEPSPPQ